MTSLVLAIAAWLTLLAPAADEPTVDQVAAIESEYRLATRAAWEAREQAPTQREGAEAYKRLVPNRLNYLHRLLDLAESAPTTPAALRAAQLVFDEGGQVFAPIGYQDEIARALMLMTRHHGDNPEAIRIGLFTDNALDEHRDTLVRRFYASAQSRESKGLARLVLAQYLELKSNWAAYAREHPGRSSSRIEDGHDLEGNLLPPTYVYQSDEEYAYKLQIEQCDPEALRREAIRLYDELIAEYADVPCVTLRDREFQHALAQPTPTLRGRPLTEEDQRKLQARLDRIPTLAEAAIARLDDWMNLAIGKPAPEIDGVDVEGRPLKLSDHLGKVVLLVFWGSWCGPCMQQVPQERELTARYAGRPFTVLGVNCKEPAEKARATMEKEGMTWPSWHDGEEHGGPIVSLYHVQSYPEIFVLDASGTIRARELRGSPLDALVETLVREAEANVSPIE